LGCAHIWLLDPDARLFEIYALDAHGQYVRSLGGEGRIDRVPGCEHLVVDLAALWRKLDALGDAPRKRRRR
jgi:hypothetical protein